MPLVSLDKPPHTGIRSMQHPDNIGCSTVRKAQAVLTPTPQPQVHHHHIANSRPNHVHSCSRPTM
jgi:hypothetical protein